MQRTRGQTREAVELQSKAVEIFQKNANETGSLEYRKHLAAGLEKLAKSWDCLRQREQAEECYQRAILLREAIAREYPSHLTRHELATTLFLFADFKRDAGMMERALRLWEEMLPRHPEYRVYVENAKRMLSKWR